MDEGSYTNCSDVDDVIPDKPGVYCLRIKNINSLPSEFADVLKGRKHNIIYVGIATKSLKRRFLGQELRARGHGTFFRSIGSMLGYKPPKGSLSNKKNKRNYKFFKNDEKKIIAWINKHLVANWTETDKELESLEDWLIKTYLPLVNLDKNPFALDKIRKLRKECQLIANSS